jgi:hypothetical protein
LKDLLRSKNIKMVNCCAVGCSSNSKAKSNKKISFYQLPRDKSLKKVWLAKIKRANLPREENIKVCNLHFEESCFERDLKNELLGNPCQRLLKKDAFPTLFNYNVDLVVTKKRPASERREHEARKKQDVKDAFNTYTEEMDQCCFEVVNSKQNADKETQTYIETQTITHANASTQTNISYSYQSQSTNKYHESGSHSDSYSSDNEPLESSFYASQTEDTESSDEDCVDNHCVSSGAAFIVYWSSLVLLLKQCLNCQAVAFIESFKKCGSAISVILHCSNGHTTTWRSQPLINRFYEGNVKLAACVLFSSNTYMKMCKYFSLAGVSWISKSSYYNLHRNVLIGVTNSAWLEAKSQVETEISQRGGKCSLSGDGRCDSPGHNAKYLTYTLLDQLSKKIVSLSPTQVTEAGNSNRMELFTFKKVINEVKSYFSLH